MMFFNKYFKRNKGFTLMELVLVVALLGILAVTAIPKIFDINLANARTASMNSTVGAVQVGIATYAATEAAAGNAISYPASLDGAADNSTASGANPLLGSVLQNGVTAQWFKVSGTCYVYDTDGDGTKDANPVDTYFLYTVLSGTFAQAVAGCS